MRTYSILYARESGSKFSYHTAESCIASTTASDVMLISQYHFLVIYVHVGYKLEEVGRLSKERELYT